jgi:hypothetical protein
MTQYCQGPRHPRDETSTHPSLSSNVYGYTPEGRLYCMEAKSMIMICIALFVRTIHSILKRRLWGKRRTGCAI